MDLHNSTFDILYMRIFNLLLSIHKPTLAPSLSGPGYWTFCHEKIFWLMLCKSFACMKLHSILVYLLHFVSALAVLQCAGSFKNRAGSRSVCRRRQLCKCMNWSMLCCPVFNSYEMCRYRHGSGGWALEYRSLLGSFCPSLSLCCHDE